MLIEPILLGLVIFVGVFLIASIKSIHCPYWQLPFGASLLIGSAALSFIATITWTEIGLSWLFGAGTAILVVVARTNKAKK